MEELEKLPKQLREAEGRVLKEQLQREEEQRRREAAEGRALEEQHQRKEEQRRREEAEERARVATHLRNLLLSPAYYRCPCMASTATATRSRRRTMVPAAAAYLPGADVLRKHSAVRSHENEGPAPAASRGLQAVANPNDLKLEKPVSWTTPDLRTHTAGRGEDYRQRTGATSL
ncbi:hypothetical protein BGZ61DRAFT_485226 [Ilyonectria robusta]|uniref:uncharacterized protein n=1 Tax=Ilyonectria robusta TaxID=1079257 RepID=UPI001E8E18DD|nr:uncharacterized protein BGZ61DRAFT_485226 [Ilyonectria robusta]KAH8662773.1 hypothetical protein BGZ61DRAFT_485226 [Ilyonectria robusta]